jgi:hypothetical protein
MEAIYNTFSATGTTPVAMRAPAPGPLANPLSPTVAITAIDGVPLPAAPQGIYGGVDYIMPATGTISVDLAATGVPGGTTINITVKPQVGSTPGEGSAVLGNCDADGNCTANANIELASAGKYFIEARATFQTP